MKPLIIMKGKQMRSKGLFNKKIILSVLVWVVLFSYALSQNEIDNRTPNNLIYKHSIDTSPISPLIDIYGIHYNYHFTEQDEFIAGLGYMRIGYDFGNTNSVALIVGYRRYLWEKLHIEYQLWPSYDDFYESNEDKYYPSYDLWNEFRLGYQFDFQLFEKPFYASIQWPFGFGLYASNKPDSFKEHEKENRFFYHVPLIFVGYRF